MSVTHNASIQNSIADIVLTEIDTGAGNATIELQTSLGVEVATLIFSDPAGSVVGPVLTFDSLTADPGATGGLATKFVIISPALTECLYGSVGVIGEDINLSSVDIQPGHSVEITILTYTAPP